MECGHSTKAKENKNNMQASGLFRESQERAGREAGCRFQIMHFFKTLGTKRRCDVKEVIILHSRLQKQRNNLLVCKIGITTMATHRFLALLDDWSELHP